MSQSQVPGTPRVISPSPTPSETGSQDGYFGPTTRSAARKRLTTPTPIDEETDDDVESNDDLRRSARSKSRSPMRKRKLVALTKVNGDSSSLKSAPLAVEPQSNGHLSPVSANKGWNWRDISRSPSPLGLIPIHRHWRSFVHRHEVPRKILHVSIGFFSLYAYIVGVQTTAITPWLMGALIPIATTDFLRFKFESLNRLYVRVMGAFMREKEYNGWNGVIWYLLGVWIVLSFFPKDIGLMGVLLLSWCDTAASTIGRAYGRYTPRIRKGKSLAGSLAALLVGVVTAAGFWGYVAPKIAHKGFDDGWPFMFQGTLELPEVVRNAVGFTAEQASIHGSMALAVMSLVTGFVASGSEVVDIFGWDDNLTIPVLSGVGLWAFLKVFG